MTKIAEVANGATFNQRCIAFEILEADLPADGSITISLASDVTANSSVGYSVYLLDGVHQDTVASAQITTANSSSATSLTIDNVITSAATHVILAAASYNQPASALTQPSGHTEVFDANVGSGSGTRGGGSYRAYTGSSETLSMTYASAGSASRSAALSISYGEPSAGGGSIVPRIIAHRRQMA
jgi:hypothetical protein